MMQTLEQAKLWLRQRVDDGERCPCCTQHAKVYRRKLNSSMAFGLVTMYQIYGTDWGHAPSTGTLARLGGELARLRMWGLVEEMEEKRDDGGRAGYWRVTPKGVDFVKNKMRVPKYARIYDGRLLKLDVSSDMSIIEALGTKFNYNELMQGI